MYCYFLLDINLSMQHLYYPGNISIDFYQVVYEIYTVLGLFDLLTLISSILELMLVDQAYISTLCYEQKLVYFGYFWFV